MNGRRLGSIAFAAALVAANALLYLTPTPSMAGGWDGKCVQEGGGDPPQCICEFTPVNQVCGTWLKVSEQIEVCHIYDPDMCAPLDT